MGTQNRECACAGKEATRKVTIRAEMLAQQAASLTSINERTRILPPRTANDAIFLFCCLRRIADLAGRGEGEGQTET